MCEEKKKKVKQKRRKEEMKKGGNDFHRNLFFLSIDRIFLNALFFLF